MIFYPSITKAIPLSVDLTSALEIDFIYNVGHNILQKLTFRFQVFKIKSLVGLLPQPPLDAIDSKISKFPLQ